MQHVLHRALRSIIGFIFNFAVRMKIDPYRMAMSFNNKRIGVYRLKKTCVLAEGFERYRSRMAVLSRVSVFICSIFSINQ